MEITYDGVNNLGRGLQGRMKISSEQPVVIDFGEILEDYCLKTNTYPIPIPTTDYLVCRHLTIGLANEPFTQTAEGQGTHPHGPSGSHSQYQGSGEHSHPASEGGHVHDILLPDKMKRLEPGDRVIVAWSGTDAVVIDVICSAQELQK